MTRAALLALPIALATQARAPRPPLPPGVSVERVFVDARVLDRGRAVPELPARHFRVRIDGRTAEVVSATWISARRADSSERVGALRASGASEAPGSDAAARRGEPNPGRLLVLFVQKDLHPSRAAGLLQLLGQAGRLVDSLGPDDRAAVVSFDSRLRLWQDFTSDPVLIRRALAHDILLEAAPRGGPPSDVSLSLAAHLGAGASRRAARPETALRLIGEALRPISGSKTLVFLGFGFGELQGSALSVHPDYGAARRALLEAGVSVFTLDVTDADRHTLEVGLRQVAEDTGGFYARTHLFSTRALTWLEEVLEGHYVLEVVPPGGPRGRHSLEVDLVGRRGEVLARSAYFD